MRRYLRRLERCGAEGTVLAVALRDHLNEIDRAAANGEVVPPGQVRRVGYRSNSGHAVKVRRCDLPWLLDELGGIGIVSTWPCRHWFAPSLSPERWAALYPKRPPFTSAQEARIREILHGQERRRAEQLLAKFDTQKADPKSPRRRGQAFGG